MKIFRHLILTIILIVIIGIFALSLFALNFDSNHYKAELAELISEQTGRDVTIDGDLTLAIFPDISIKTGKVSVGNAVGFTDKNFASVYAADISVKFLPLLQKKLKVNTVILHGLNLNLHRKQSGENNWDDLAGSQATTGDTSDVSEVVSKMIAGLTVSGVSVKDSEIHWQDDITGQKIDLSQLTLKTGRYKADKPLDIQFSTQLKQNTPSIKLKLEASTRLTLNKDKQAFSLENLKLNTHLTGSIAKDGTIDSKLTGDVSGNNKIIQIPNMTLQSDITGGLAPNGKISTSISGNTHFKIQKQNISITGMTLDSTVTGKTVQGGTLTAHLTANTNFNMLEQLLSLSSMQSKIQLQDGPLAGGQLIADVSGNTQVNLQNSSLKINKLKLTSTTNSPSIPNGELKQDAQGEVSLNWADNTGSADLSSLVISLANLQLTGSAKINQLMTTPEINGNFQSNAFNLSELLKAFGIQAPKINKAGLLGQTQTSFSLIASPSKAILSELSLKLDDSQIAGNLSVQNFEHPIISGKLTIDQLNMDSYLSPETTTESSNAAASALLPLAAMRNLDVDTHLSIGSLVYSKIKMNDASVQLNAKNGVVKADPISAKLYKGKYTGNIHLNTSKEIPAISMRHTLQDLRSEGLLYDLFEDKLVTGSANMTSDINTSGNSVTTIKQNLAGTINVTFLDGTIRDSNFAKKTEIAIGAFEQKKANDSGESQVKFTKLSGDWLIKNGIFTTDEMTMNAPQFGIKGSGDVDIVKEKLDFKLNIAPNEKKDKRNIFIPLRIYGVFDKIKYQLRLDELIKQLAKEDLEKEKQKLREQLKKEEDKLAERLKKQKQAEIDKLKAKRDDAKQKLQDKIDQKSQDLKDKLQQEKQRLNEQLKNNAGDKLEEKLKSKLKGLL